ncbi:MAG: MFS transporter [Chloroflexi bacterium]|nr:MFS transporter [Chloroflexota bacterium]
MIAVLWLTYAGYYLGRMNLSPALTAIAEGLALSRAEVGLLGTAVTWAYAAGQIVNGELGNHFSPHRIVLLGLLTIAGANLLLGLQTALLPMIVLCLINGFAQASGWGPMLRILAERLNPFQQRRIAMPFPLSYQVGAAASLALAALLIVSMGWQAAFIVPGGVLLLMAALWWLLGVDVPKAAQTKAPFSWRSLWGNVVGIWPLLLGAVVMGLVYSGAGLWLPAYFADTGLFPGVFISVVVGIMPLIGAGGMLLTGLLLRRLHSPLRVMRLLLLAIVASMLLAVATTGYVQVACIALLSLELGGTSALMTTAIPLLVASEGRASSAAGTINAVHSVGGALAGVLVGALIEGVGWGGVFGLWALCALVAWGLSLLMRGR